MKFKVMAVVFAIGSTSSLAQTPSLQTRSLECRIQYGSAQDLRLRPVQIVYQAKQIVQVTVDAQPVYAFSLVGSKLLTSVDSERIQIDFQKHQINWHSNLRDILFGEGVCVSL
ncbi:MAG: hypothetical protein QM533_07490 [Cytophagales bacterium]|nr:hypothetical protein [Cytophagales bacterium]